MADPLPSLLLIIFEEMEKRGWEIESRGHGQVIFRKNGRPYGTLDEAVFAQSMQEIADQVIEETDKNVIGMEWACESCEFHTSDEEAALAHADPPTRHSLARRFIR